MTTFRISGLESFGFEWVVSITTWEDRLSELANYRKINGHCNVPKNYSENPKLAQWAAAQRKQYKLHLKDKISSMTLSRIQELESLDFEWRPSIGRKRGSPRTLSPDDDATRVRERAVEATDHRQLRSHKKIAVIEKSAAIKSTSLSNQKISTEMAKSTLTTLWVEPQNIRRGSRRGRL
jgi:hypothetical protein